MIGRTKNDDVVYWDGITFKPLVVIVLEQQPPIAQPVSPAVNSSQVVLQLTTAYNAKTTKMKDISIAQDGTIVGINHADEVCQWDGISWQQIKGNVYYTELTWIY